jgi:leucyl-tRNA---protein transferase
MFSIKHRPTHLPQQALDAYLEKGWFRMNQTLFITHFLHLESRFYPAVWLRYSLKNGIGTLISKKLKPIQRHFRMRVTPWEYTPEQEALFSDYRNSAGFEMAATLMDLLMGYEEVNIFKTFQVEMYEDDRLIALGIFDIGQKSAAGICNIFHPDYRKFSLGKALIYAKMQYSLQLGFEWFYPGYAVPGKGRFNYKLGIAPNHTEYFCPVSRKWLPHAHSGPLPNLLHDMEAALGRARDLALAAGRKCPLVYYLYFDAGLSGLDFTDLLHYPIFLLIGYEPRKGKWLIAVYDLVSGTYSALRCHSLYSPIHSNEYDRLVCTDLLQVTESLASGLDLPDFFNWMENFGF